MATPNFEAPMPEAEAQARFELPYRGSHRLNNQVEAYMGMAPEEQDAWLRESVDALRAATADGPSTELASNLFFLARISGDSRLIEADETGDIQRLLNGGSLQDQSPYVEFKDDIPASGYHFSDKRMIQLSSKLLNPRSYGVRELKRSGVTFRHPQDAVLINVLSTAAHEGGHALHALANKQIDASGIEYPELKQFAPVLLYLRHKPELAFTGNLKVDVRTREEQSAEGYARLSIEPVLSAMGYSEKEVGKLMKALMSGHHVRAARGKSTIDLLQQREGVKSRYKIDPDDINGDFANLGHIGYSHPLSFDEFKDQLQNAAQIARSERVASGVSQTRWGDMVNGTPLSPYMRKRITEMQKERRDYLHPVRANVRLFAGAAAMAGVLYTGAMNGLDAIEEASPGTISDPAYKIKKVTGELASGIKIFQSDDRQKQSEIKAQPQYTHQTRPGYESYHKK